MKNDNSRVGLAGVLAEYGSFLYLAEDPATVNEEESLKLLQRAYGVAPESFFVLHHLGAILSRTGKWEEVVSALKGLPENESAPDFFRAWAAARTAMALAHLDQEEAARQMLTKATSAAESLEDREDIDQYLADVNQLLQGEPPDPTEDDDNHS